MLRYLAATMSGIFISLGALSIIVGIHDASAEEDTKVVWVCSVQGNKVCGSDMSPITVRLSNLYI